MEQILNVNDFMRGNFMFVKMVMIYVRGAKERRYLRDLLGPLVRQVLEDDFLDLESDPLMVSTPFLCCTLLSIFQPLSFLSAF